MGKKRKNKGGGGDEDARKRRFGGGDVEGARVVLNYDEDCGRGNNKPVTSGPMDAEFGQRVAFPGLDNVDRGVDSIDNGPPLSVEDYLRTVKTEASSRPSFVVAKDKAVRPVVPPGRGVLRSYEQHQAEDDGIPHGRQIKKTTRRPVAPVEIDGNWAVLFLEQFSRTKEDISRGLARVETLNEVELPQTFSKWRQFVLSPENAPHLSLLKRLDHALVVKLIGYCHKWVSSKMAPELAQWIYSLLVLLPDTVIGDDVSTLRELAKKCIQVKQNPHWPLNPVTAYTLDMVITIVARYYKQLDLLQGDPYN
ncbi:hypothetical protein TRICI_006489 [Trichomonascus ciferrii]|uniref:Gem-associated protein 2 n=1 Tax=Trichomonascus ciferrii TaxID=44093 RepID=A0A642UGU0_9ASCO|nr:hypothetical protein TRICI_006489 [Trichomonascus ciferrii]